MLYNYNVFNTLLYFCWRKKCQKNLKKLELLARTLLFQNCANIIGFIKKLIFSQDFLHRHRKSEKDFTRKRKLPFPTLIQTSLREVVLPPDFWTLAYLRGEFPTSSWSNFPAGVTTLS